jgi:hypothetical protein
MLVAGTSNLFLLVFICRHAGAGTVASYYYPDSSYFKLDPPKIKLRSEEIVGNIWERTIDKGVVSVSAAAHRVLDILSSLA